MGYRKLVLEICGFSFLDFCDCLVRGCLGMKNRC